MDDDPDRNWTAEDIRTEHHTALAAFTPLQARALARISRSFRESRMSNSSAKEMMEVVFEHEAAERNQERARRNGSRIEWPSQPPALEQTPIHGVRSEGFSDTEGG